MRNLSSLLYVSLKLFSAKANYGMRERKGAHARTEQDQSCFGLIWNEPVQVCCMIQDQMKSRHVWVLFYIVPD